MTRAQLEALAARVEAAQGADRELDEAVARATGWDTECGELWWTPAQVAERRRLKVSRWRHQPVSLPAYTASLDAAASLVPSGWRVSQVGEWDHDTLRTRGPWFAILIPAGKSDDFSWVTKARCNHAATPALALTAAALRARAMEASDAE